MPGIGLGISIAKSGSGATVLTPAQVVGDFMGRAGLVDSAIQTALTTFVTSLKTANLWSKYLAIYPLVGGTALAHSQNLVSAEFPITWNGTVFHDTQGARSDGTTGHGNTGINVNTLTLADFSLQCYETFADVGVHTALGAHDGGDAMYQVAVTASLFYADCNNLSNGRLTTSIATPPAGGFGMSNRKTSATASLWYAGGIQGNKNTAATQTSFNGNLYILALNHQGLGAPSNYHKYPLKFAAVAKSIPDANLAALAGYINTLQTSLGRAFDTNATDYLSRIATTDGLVVSTISKFVADLKSSGAWTTCNGIYPFIGGNATAHAQNLKANILNLTFTNAPTHDANGITGNGTTSYATVGSLTNLSNLAHRVHGLVYCRTAAPTAGGAFWGCVKTTGGTSRFVAFHNGAAALGGNMNDDGFTGVNGAFLGVIGYDRTTTTNVYGIIRTSTSVNPAVNSVAIVNQPLLLLARSYEGFANDLFTNANLSYASFGFEFTQPELVAYSNLIEGLQVSLGRNV